MCRHFATNKCFISLQSTVWHLDTHPKSCYPFSYSKFSSTDMNWYDSQIMFFFVFFSIFSSEGKVNNFKKWKLWIYIGQWTLQKFKRKNLKHFIFNRNACHSIKITLSTGFYFVQERNKAFSSICTAFFRFEKRKADAARSINFVVWTLTYAGSDPPSWFPFRGGCWHPQGQSRMQHWMPKITYPEISGFLPSSLPEKNTDQLESTGKGGGGLLYSL